MHPAYGPGRTPDDPRWPAAAFDSGIGFNILHLVRGRVAALAGLHRVLKPGGLLITKTVSLTEMNPAIRLAVPVMRAMRPPSRSRMTANPL